MNLAYRPLHKNHSLFYMSKFQNIAGFVFSILIFSSCQTHFTATSVRYKDYKINPTSHQSNQLDQLLQPYSDSVNKSMNIVIASTSTGLEKKQPECTLGNVMADAMLNMGEQHLQSKIDAAFVNYGGIRLPSVAPGNITLGKVFEMAPFDNIIVIQQLSGKQVQQFADFVSEKGGWPCSGISFQIRSKKAVNIRIGGVLIEESKMYAVANIDYVANGGDDCELLKNIPQLKNGYLFRDAIIDYFKGFTAAGKTISAKLENRVSYAE